ncbi:MAG TPA: hypothetical protein ENG03_11050 [Thioploca sp.]|nr:MAG: hypothetical protein DRR19_09745 [Gammaproteobacteria bacterium]HDN27611.1 hypothetical protein [Thioploca sp.]
MARTIEILVVQKQIDNRQSGNKTLRMVLPPFSQERCHGHNTHFRCYVLKPLWCGNALGTIYFSVTWYHPLIKRMNNSYRLDNPYSYWVLFTIGCKAISQVSGGFEQKYHNRRRCRISCQPETGRFLKFIIITIGKVALLPGKGCR